MSPSPNAAAASAAAMAQDHDHARARGWLRDNVVLNVAMEGAPGPTRSTAAARFVQSLPWRHLDVPACLATLDNDRVNTAQRDVFVCDASQLWCRAAFDVVAHRAAGEPHGARRAVRWLLERVCVPEDDCVLEDPYFHELLQLMARTWGASACTWISRQMLTHLGWPVPAAAATDFAGGARRKKKNNHKKNAAPQCMQVGSGAAAAAMMSASGGGGEEEWWSTSSQPLVEPDPRCLCRARCCLNLRKRQRSSRFLRALFLASQPQDHTHEYAAAGRRRRRPQLLAAVIAHWSAARATRAVLSHALAPLMLERPRRDLLDAAETADDAAVFAAVLAVQPMCATCEDSKTDDDEEQQPPQQHKPKTRIITNQPQLAN